ncbi:MAG: hypothetical protein IJ353_06465 [Lachnospiraceae bacterium]|nr:hypothetical protein [Lachnospiraceae bacterium]
MNIFHFLPPYLPFLDVAFGPSFSMGEIDPATKVIVIVVLIAFLGFIGYLIWNSLKKDK